MRISTLLAACLLVVGLATMIPTSIVAVSRSDSPRFDCNVTCLNGTCSATGTGCSCWCDHWNQPHCGCDQT